MSSDKNKIAADCFKRGNDSTMKEDWEYAIKMYCTSIAMAPDNLLYRQTLRGVVGKKYKNNKTGAKMAGVKLMGARGKIKKARMKKDWAAINKAAEEGLLLNPWDAQLNADMAEACRNLGYDEVAQYGYQRAAEADPDNIGFWKSLASILEERGSYKEAISCWDRIYKLDPLDSDARSKITQLQASTVLDRGGYADAKDTKDVKTAYDFDQSSGQQPPSDGPGGPGESVEADLQRAIRKDESNKSNYLKLADFYRREKRYEEAAEQLKTAVDISGGDQTIREQLEDVELVLLKQNLDLAKEAAKADAEDETARKNVKALRREFVHREIEIFSSRVERYPKDSKLKFELAQRLMKLKDWPKSIPLLQQASADKRIGAEVLVALGECFFNDKKKDLARRQFEKSLGMIEQHDRPDLFKKIRYALGLIAELDGEKSKAEDHYQEILAVDYEYRDVLKRLENMTSGGNDESTE